ncbi:vesicle transport V-SNARE protein superfamily [Histoplasma capsulatum G186AR]|uniref:Golgi SNAP receptor complex member 1 n=2 Tax=Ajellomyces capsulatus TaxID=5037 RepID=C0NJ91_AJECG|nr:vesicle transport V-SNARE protein superfamily [Histoplasma capsulatum G186AR]EEH07932.1 vesicle transport V-SNARE protein superfamily [Histoplasma capsulatum G186AR]KAG5299738.1 vesicle transport V-SNARE protein superfamily [Histoplasma capsulatum]QSS67635.1 vesicle transport V-SNARE protein superfamily [Histoplasma capsulatum G186AR]
MATATGTGWAQLRQQARSLETQTETLFHTYAQYASLSQLPMNPSEDEVKAESQIHEILERREALISQLARLLDSESALTSSALKQNNLSRHREILRDHRRELKRLNSAIAETRDRANLLSNVRSDINAYRSSASSNQNNNNAEAEYMLEERGHLENSHNMMDSVLSQAYAVNENFGLQRESLARINRRIVGAASHVPGMNSLIHKIGAKRRRDGIILGVFIGVCFLMVFFFR